MDLVVAAVPAGAADQLALEEALVRAAPRAPLLRLWSGRRAVVVGRFQHVDREVALDACARDGVPVLRRASGGGTVVHDAGTLNVTLVLPGRVLDAQRRLADLLTRTLAALGVTAVPDPRGLHVAGRKLAGWACLQTRDATLAHASLLVSTDAATVLRYLTPAPAVADRRDSHRAPTASLAEHGVGAGPTDVTAALRAAAGDPRPRPLTPAERAVWRRLATTRYRDPGWHGAGRAKEAAWTSAPASTSTG